MGKSSLTPGTIILEEPVTAMKIRQPAPVAAAAARGPLTAHASLIYRRGTQREPEARGGRGADACSSFETGATARRADHDDPGQSQDRTRRHRGVEQARPGAARQAARREARLRARHAPDRHAGP